MVISIFQNFNEVVQNQKIIEVLHDIRTGKYINVMIYLRKSLADNKMEAYERAKKSLPAFTPLATFKGGRKPEQLTNAKTLTKDNPYTFSCFTSSSGNGLKILVKVNSAKENHKEAFLILQKYYEELLQLPIDKSGKDVTRLCFVSYDTDLYLNENAAIYPVIQQQIITTAPISKDYSAIYEHCIRFTEKKKITSTAIGTILCICWLVILIEKAFRWQ